MWRYLTADPFSCQYPFNFSCFCLTGILVQNRCYLFTKKVFLLKLIYMHIKHTQYIYHHFFKKSQYLLFWGDLWRKLLKWICGGWWSDRPITGTVFKVRYGGTLLLTTRNANTGKSVQLNREQKKTYERMSKQQWYMVNDRWGHKHLKCGGIYWS